jgi:beta-glucanase (GH16 family)
MKKKSLTHFCGGTFLLLATLGLAACSETVTELDEQRKGNANMSKTATKVLRDTQYQQSVALAINVGGDEYMGQDGIRYIADSLPIITQKGTSAAIKGSQDPTLYESYRTGEMEIPLALTNGIYDITIKFAEPDDDLQVGERLINVYAQNQLVIEELDIRLARDGMALSSLDRTVVNVAVTDGLMKLKFVGAKGTPVVHALIVRNKLSDADQWELVWHDEFDYEGRPDANKWSFDRWPARKVNDEDQAYTDRAKNVRVENGQLIIEAHKEEYDNAQYTSGRIHSMGKGDFLYGKAEVRARIPAGQGTWSAIWMLPSDPFKYATTCEHGEDWQGSHTCDAWPNSGEIDIMEYVGYDPTTIHGTVHNRAYYWRNWEQRKGSIQVDEQVNQDFQVYSMEWGPDYIAVSMNDTPYFYYANQGEGWRAWPFDHPYHLILNLAIGGAWGRSGGPIDDSLFPVRMEVDYVRIYQHK